MKILIVHNFYQVPGGEDQVFRAEGHLLQSKGHTVLRYSQHNRQVSQLAPIRLAGKTIWSQQAYAAVRDIVRSEGPDVIHVHNTLPLISPAVYYAGYAGGVPVIQTLHNYRLQCLPGDFVRDGRICEDCLGRRIPWPGVLHACYRSSRASSAAIATMLIAHRVLETYDRRVDLYIALTEFGRKKLVEGGLPASKVVVKPNFVEVDPGSGHGSGGYAIFVGRLSPAKGVQTLLTAWRQTDSIMPLLIVGDGPLAREVTEAARTLPTVHFLGWQGRDTVLDLMKQASVLILPSQSYEGFALVIVEAFSTGLPVVASDLGAMSEIVQNRRTGLLFTPGDAPDLANKISWLQHHPEALAAMRLAVRKEYEQKYTAERNYEMLMDIYRRVINARSSRRPPAGRL